MTHRNQEAMATKNTKRHEKNDHPFRAGCRPFCLSLFVIFCVFCGHCSSAWSAEITTNGTGGGPWTDTATWRGGAVPKADDEVTVRKGDTVVFDRNDDGKVTCAKLFIDPDGGLKFKTGAGKVVFVTPGPIESFGLLKLDGTAAADDFHELRLTGKTPEDRTVKFEKGGALVVSGKANLPGGKRNVLIGSKCPDPKAADPSAKVTVKGGILDVQRADFQDVKLDGDDIDNTGAKAGQRCNVIGNRFLGKGNLSLVSCDTPAVTDNLLDYPGGPWQQPAAIALNGCPLADVKNNTIKGYFYYAFSVYGCTDAVLKGNTTEKAYVGVYCVGATMFKANTFREAGTAFVVTSINGTLEDTVIEKTAIGMHINGGTVQMANTVFRDPPKEHHAIDFAAGELTLINCNFGPEQVTLPKTLPKTDKPMVTAMHYLVVKVNGDVEEDTAVDVRTVNPNPPIAAGAADLNVRNAPAPLLAGRTPLPQSLSPLMVKSWVIDKDGKTVPAPEYTVRVVGPSDGVKERPVFKTLTVKPDAKWFREKPNDPTPTLEVNLK
jgi:hypothetical protein